uniref:Uncharacterized protein n=1 Tax=Rhizophora mucronata TaxID=61149 RepID=A0A2P2QY52_RHIMU
MNFIDFFAFLSRLFLANMVQLHCTRRNSQISSSSSSWITQQVAVNLISIRRTASRMKSINLAGNDGFFLDFRESVRDPEFLRLCTDIGRVYGMRPDQQNCCCDTTKAFIAELLNHGSHLYSIEDFVEFTDCALERFGIACGDEDMLLPRLND